MQVLTGTEISHSNDQTETGAETVSTTLIGIVQVSLIWCTHIEIIILNSNTKHSCSYYSYSMWNFTTQSLVPKFT